jgi:hypothetical protein
MDNIHSLSASLKLSKRLLVISCEDCYFFRSHVLSHSEYSTVTLFFILASYCTVIHSLSCHYMVSVPSAGPSSTCNIRKQRLKPLDDDVDEHLGSCHHCKMCSCEMWQVLRH